MAGVFLLPFLFGQVGVGIIYALLLRLAARILFLAHVNVQNKRRPLSIIGAVLFLVGIMLVSTLADRIPIGALLAILLCFGTGSGLVLQSSFIEAQSAVSSDGKTFPDEHYMTASADSIHQNRRRSHGKFISNRLRIPWRCNWSHDIGNDQPFKSDTKPRLHPCRSYRKLTHPPLLFTSCSRTLSELHVPVSFSRREDSSKPHACGLSVKFSQEGDFPQCFPDKLAIDPEDVDRICGSRFRNLNLFPRCKCEWRWQRRRR